MRNTFKKMPMLLLCIAVTFSGLLAGPVSADDWNILTSAHFKIHYHSGDDNQARFVQDVLGMA